MRLPRRIRLLDYTIAVIQVTRRWMREEYGDDVVGVWQHEDLAIYVVRSLPTRRKRQVFLHELGHAVADLLDQEVQA